MKLDVKATKRAREVHAAGVKRLNELFRINDRELAVIAMRKQARTPKRRRPGLPIDRSERQRARHRRRKLVKAARRANR